MSYARYTLFPGASSGGGGGGITAIGTIDSGTPSANGASISGSNLLMQSASATVPGLVNVTTQTFAGTKSFTGQVISLITGDDINPAICFKDGSTYFGLGVGSDSQPGLLGLGGLDLLTFNRTDGAGWFEGGIKIGLAFRTGPGQANLWMGTEQDTGWYRSAADVWAFTANGSHIFSLSALGIHGADSGAGVAGKTLNLKSGTSNAGGGAASSIALGGAVVGSQAAGVQISGAPGGTSETGGPVSVVAGDGATGAAGGNAVLIAGADGTFGSVGGNITANGAAADGTPGDTVIEAGDARAGSGKSGGNNFFVAGQGDGQPTGENFYVGHLVSQSQGYPQPTVAAGAQAGSGASASLDSDATDVVGTITFVAGTGLTSGAQVVLTFGGAFPTAPKVFLQAVGSTASARLVSNVVSPSANTTTFTISFGAGTAVPGDTYVWNYLVIGNRS